MFNAWIPNGQSPMFDVREEVCPDDWRQLILMEANVGATPPRYWQPVWENRNWRSSIIIYKIVSFIFNSFYFILTFILQIVSSASSSWCYHFIVMLWFYSCYNIINATQGNSLNTQTTNKQCICFTDVFVCFGILEEGQISMGRGGRNPAWK